MMKNIVKVIFVSLIFVFVFSLAINIKESKAFPFPTPTLADPGYIHPTETPYQPLPMPTQDYLPTPTQDINPYPDPYPAPNYEYKGFDFILFLSMIFR